MAAFCAWALAHAAMADTVELKDGLKLNGRVVDLGGNSVELQLRADTGRRLLLRDIRSAAFEVSTEPLAPDSDIVFRKNGSSLQGKVEMTADGKSVAVSRADGGRIEIPRADVKRIVYRDEARTESIGVYSERVRDEIQAALAAVKGRGKEAELAEEKLIAHGIFAIKPVEEALQKAKAGSAERLALDRVARFYHLREVTSDPLQELTDYYRVLARGTVADKRSLIEEMFTRFVEESVPVAKFLVRDRTEDPSVRAWAIDLLGRMQLNRDLIDIYNDPQGGQVQLAAAIALARNRILVGAESLIEAMEMDEAGVRQLAFNALKGATSKDFGFGVHDTPGARREAIRKWKEWWNQNRQSVQAQAANILSGQADLTQTPERRKALMLWQQGCQAWDGKKFAEAESLLRQATQADSLFVSAQVSLGVLLALHRGKGDEGRKMLEGLLERRLPELGSGDTTWIHYYLGRAWDTAGNPERAEVEYRNAHGIDPRFFRAPAALGDLKLREATSKEGRQEDRRAQLRDALDQYRVAIELIDAYNVELETLALTDLPVETAPAFERQVHNRTVLDVKANLRIRKAEIHFAVARIRSLLGDGGKAIGDLTSAIETLGDDRAGGARELLVELHNYRAVLYENGGEMGEALREYRRVIKEDLDPKNAAAREGVRRLRQKSGTPAAARE